MYTLLTKLQLMTAIVGYVLDSSVLSMPNDNEQSYANFIFCLTSSSGIANS